METDEILKMAKNFQKDFDKIIEFNNGLLSQLPAEYDKQKAEIKADIESVINAAKKNDITKLNELMRKYGNSNNR